MKCPKCGAQCELELEFTGGCFGHEPGEYCYCDSKDAHFLWVCHAKLKTPVRGLFKGFCNFESDPIPGLTDKYAIERWVKQRLEV